MRVKWLFSWFGRLKPWAKIRVSRKLSISLSHFTHVKTLSNSLTRSHYFTSLRQPSKFQTLSKWASTTRIELKPLSRCTLTSVVYLKINPSKTPILWNTITKRHCKSLKSGLKKKGKVLTLMAVRAPKKKIMVKLIGSLPIAFFQKCLPTRCFIFTLW